ncbi:MAG TPA: shikimate kinase AroK [Gammaproteobacteria bacterium]
MSRATRNIYLIGPTGSGKTAVGKQLARDTGLKFLDSDHEIERRTGVEISYIFEKEGESGFRERESDVICQLSTLEGTVIATGGGAVLAKTNRDCLSTSGTVVYLKTGIEEQLRRTSQSRKRPLLNNDDPRSVLERMASVRAPLYEEIADLSVDTSNQRVRTVARKVRELLEQRGDLALEGNGREPENS